MHRYRVMSFKVDETRRVLKCSSGRLHLVRALNAPPPEGAVLGGAKPHLGFGILTCTVSGAIFRVMFEAINHTKFDFDSGWMELPGNELPDAQPKASRPRA